MPKKPASLDSLTKSLTKAWRQYNIVSVGSAFGYASSKDTTEPCWRLFAYTNDPDNVGRLLPVSVESDGEKYPVDVKPVNQAVNIDEN